MLRTIIRVINLITSILDAAGLTLESQVKLHSTRLKEKARVIRQFQRFDSPFPSERKFKKYIDLFWKYKHHEWCVFAVENQQGIERFWVKKGTKNEVSLHDLPEEEILEEVPDGRGQILVFHNHPGGLALQSGQDKQLFSTLRNELAWEGVSVRTFIYASGLQREYTGDIRDFPKAVLEVMLQW